MYDVIIIGSGPAGLTAAIYTSRADLKTAVIAGRSWGGQLMLTSLVENFPGFPEGIMGPALMMNMRKQAQHHGAEILDVDFKTADLTSSKNGSNIKVFEIITDEDKKILSKSIIITSGAQTRWLGVPGEAERIGRGVSSCAPCDAVFFRNKKVIVVGGGDSALEEAQFLTKFASAVFVVHRRSELRASKIMQKRVFENKKITFVWNTDVIEISGDEKVEKVKLSSNLKSQNSKLQLKSQNQEKEVMPEEIGGKRLETKDQQLIWEFPVDGIFVAIGHMPNSKLFKGIETDEKGFIKVRNHMKTNIEGVFVAGDVHDHTYKQAITAAGYGCMAALEVERWLSNQAA